MQENLFKYWYKKWWGILSIVVSFFVITALVLSGNFLYQLGQKMKNGDLAGNRQFDFAGQKKYDAMNDSSFWTGAPNPKVTIVEFGDFSCPHCKASFPVIRSLSVNHRKEIKLVFRDFPVVSEHSIDLARSARCAGEQGYFWSMHDKLFMNQGVATSSQLAALAQQTGANMAKYDECFKSQKYDSAIYKDVSDGQSLGVTATPTWFVNGYKLEGDVPADVWEKIITELINQPN